MRMLILEIRQVYKLPGHVLFPFRFPMRFQAFDLATAEIAQLFCEAGSESVAVGQHVIRQHLRGYGAFTDSRLREPFQERPHGA